MAAQLTATSDRVERELARWNACATPSLPVPLSPRTCRVVPLRAARAASSSTACIAGPRTNPSIVRTPARSNGRTSAHGTSSESPMRMTRWTGAAVRGVMGSPSTKVPFWLPRSVTTQRPASNAISACRRETRPSSTLPGPASLRPTSSGPDASVMMRARGTPPENTTITPGMFWSSVPSRWLLTLGGRVRESTRRRNITCGGGPTGMSPEVAGGPGDRRHGQAPRPRRRPHVGEREANGAVVQAYSSRGRKNHPGRAFCEAYGRLREPALSLAELQQLVAHDLRPGKPRVCMEPGRWYRRNWRDRRA